MGVLRKQAQRLLAVPFVLDGMENLRDPAPRAKTLAPTVRQMAERYPWLPDDPSLVVRAQGAAAVVGGALLFLGRGVRLGCLVLAAQSVPTLMAKARGSMEADPAEQERQRSELVKDASLLGALLLSATEPKRRPTRARYQAEQAARKLQKPAKPAKKAKKAKDGKSARKAKEVGK